MKNRWTNQVMQMFIATAPVALGFCFAQCAWATLHSIPEQSYQYRQGGTNENAN